MTNEAMFQAELIEIFPLEALSSVVGGAIVVHPIQIAANRTGLNSLVSSNFLGLNAPAIAASEGQYAEMRAQDVNAMYGY
jgi:hypothetical protein